MKSKRYSFDSTCTKRVSFILTTKNHAKFLDKALSRFRRLVKASDELIIVDGGSTDITEMIIKKYTDIVNVYISEPDINSSHALNKGMLLSRGKYIKHLTDDDDYYPEAMEKAIKIMEKHPEVDLLVCGGTKQRGRYYSVFYVPEGVNFGKDISGIIKYGVCGVGHIYRRKSLALSGLFPLDVASDATFPIECIAAGLNVKFCRINLFNHPIYAHSAIIAKAKEHERDSDKTFSRYLSKQDYIKYKILKIWSQHSRYVEKIYRTLPGSKTLTWPARMLMIKINKSNNEKFNKSSSINLNSLISNKKYKWDGGFS